jgi:hypothetical protein
MNVINISGRNSIWHGDVGTCATLFMSSPGVAAMVQNLVTGLVVVALIIMGMLAYAQKHEGCLHGRSLQTFKPCGSVSVDL